MQLELQLLCKQIWRRLLQKPHALGIWQLYCHFSVTEAYLHHGKIVKITKEVDDEPGSPLRKLRTRSIFLPFSNAKKENTSTREELRTFANSITSSAMYEVWIWNSFGRLRHWRTLTNSKLWLCAFVNRNCLTTSGPFLESAETFRAHFRRHSSLCIFKTKASQGTKLCSYFNFSPLCNIWKDQLYRMSESEF